MTQHSDTFRSIPLGQNDGNNFEPRPEAAMVLCQASKIGLQPPVPWRLKVLAAARCWVFGLRTTTIL